MGDKLKVLWVDDDRIALKECKNLFDSLGFEVTPAYNVKEALKL